MFQIQNSLLRSPAIFNCWGITGNTFKHYDYALLHARFVDTLVFSSNRMIYTDTYPQFSREVNVYLDRCQHVTIGDNIFDAAFPGRNVWMKHMKETDLEQFGSCQLKVSLLKH